MKLNYTTNFQFRALYSIATPTLPLQASPSMYLCNICFCINIPYPLTHRNTNSHIHGYTVYCPVYIRRTVEQTVTVCRVLMYVCEHAMCVFNILLLSSQALVRTPNLDWMSANCSRLPESMIFTLLDSFRSDMRTEVITRSKCFLAVSRPLCKRHTRLGCTVAWCCRSVLVPSVCFQTRRTGLLVLTLSDLIRPGPLSWCLFDLLTSERESWAEIKLL